MTQLQSSWVKLSSVKVLSIAKGVKAKQYCPKISKIWLIRCDKRYCIIKIDFLIFELGHLVKSSLFVQLVGQKTFFVNVSIGYAHGM